jgi:hypothetical protein
MFQLTIPFKLKATEEEQIIHIPEEEDCQLFFKCTIKRLKDDYSLAMLISLFPVIQQIRNRITVSGDRPEQAFTYF